MTDRDRLEELRRVKPGHMVYPEDVRFLLGLVDRLGTELDDLKARFCLEYHTHHGPERDCGLGADCREVGAPDVAGEGGKQQ